REPAVLRRATRLAFPRAQALFRARPLGQAASARTSLAGGDGHGRATPEGARPPWWERASAEFEVSDWALRQLFGEHDPAPGPPAAEPTTAPSGARIAQE